MATEKAKRKPKRAKGESEAGRGKAEDRQSALRLRTDPRSERRFMPQPSAVAKASIFAAWVGAALVGAGIYAQWLRSEAAGPHKAAPYLLIAGAIVLLAVGLFGQREPKAVRVGDAGVGQEKDSGEIERIAWCDVTKVVLTADALTVQASGRSLTLPLPTQADAAARALAEARRRIPKRVEDVEAKALEPASDEAGEVIALEPPQVAGQRCKATDKLIAFERDARLCGRCGELYHKEGVPAACLTCGASLRD